MENYLPQFPQGGEGGGGKKKVKREFTLFFFP